MAIFDFFISGLKKLAVVDRFFEKLGTRFSGKINCSCREVAVTEKFEQESKYGLSAVIKKSDCCGEVAVSGG